MVVKQQIVTVIVQSHYGENLFEQGIRVFWHCLVQLIGQLSHAAYDVSNEGSGYVFGHVMF